MLVGPWVRLGGWGERFAMCWCRNWRGSLLGFWLGVIDTQTSKTGQMSKIGGLGWTCSLTCFVEETRVGVETAKPPPVGISGLFRGWS